MGEELKTPAALEPLLASVVSAASAAASGGGGPPLDNVATHDFAVHEFEFEPTHGTGSVDVLSAPALAYINSLRQAGVDSPSVAQVRRLLEAIEAEFTAEAMNAGVTSAQGRQWLTLMTSLYGHGEIISFLFQLGRRVQRSGWLVRSLMVDVRGFMASVDAAALVSTGYAWDMLMNRAFPFTSGAAGLGGGSGFEPAVIDWFEREVLGQPTFPNRQPATGVLEWSFALAIHSQGGGRVGAPIPAYDFDPSTPLSANIGLRLTYRQAWRPLALQRGELVRTIPLGPGQKERVSTKIVSRSKVGNVIENKTEKESTSETARTTKDSSEVVTEAAETFRWNVETKLGVKAGVFTGEVSGGMGGTSEDKSRKTASDLSEAVSKTATKMRSESKVVVNTERESSFEQERSSEIINSNDEIAITYEYYRLQQQYDVLTRLHRLESVIYVAERVPEASEVDASWIRRYDWIIARALKDESFRDDLAAVARDVERDEDPVGAGTDPFRTMMDSATTSFAQFNGGASATELAIPDIYAAPQQSYWQRLMDIAERIRSNELRSVRRNRLLQHVRDNILHYCRAIWAEEDPDQRLMRYRKENRQIANAWTQQVRRFPPTAGPNSPGLVVSPLFASAWRPNGSPIAIVDLIDPLGLLGYVGNYAVWALKPSPETPQIRSTPAGPLESLTTVGSVLVATLSTDLRGVLSVRRAEYVNANDGSLLDPALAAFRRQAAAMTSQQLASITDDQVWDYLSHFPAAADGLLSTAEPRTPRRLASGLLERPPTSEQWAQYLYRANGARRVLVDSDNLYLSLREGEGSVLEPFKRAHRYVDVLRAAEGLIAERMKNKRRLEHVDDAGSYDPDVAKVIVTGAGVVAVNPLSP